MTQFGIVGGGQGYLSQFQWDPPIVGPDPDSHYITLEATGSYGPFISYWTAVKSKQNSGLARREPFSTILRKPTVVGPGIAFHGPRVRLTDPQSPRQQNPRRAVYDLRPPPTIIGDGIVFRKIDVNLAPSSFRGANSRLNPPVVAPTGGVFTGPEVKLAQSVRPRPRTIRYGPALVGAGIVFSPIKIDLAAPNALVDRAERRKADYKLFPPAVVASSQVVTEALIKLTPQRQQVRVKSRLFPPAVVGAGIVFSPILEHLAYSRRGRPLSDLHAPAVVGAGIVFFPVSVTLAPSSRRKPKSFLRPPVLPPLAPPVEEKIVTRFVRVELADRIPHSHLFPPAVIGAGIVFAPLEVHLAVPPSSTKQFQNRRPFSRWIYPAVLTPDARAFGLIAIQLAPSSRGRARSVLFPPAVVTTVVFTAPPIATNLAISSRGITQSRLNPPAVVGDGIVFAPVSITLAPSFRGKSKPFLRPPVLPPLAPPVEEKLVTSFVRVELADRTPHSRLFPPAVIGAGIVFRPIETHLAYSLRGTPKSFLRPPVLPPLAPPVVEKIVTNYVRVELADRTPHSHLFPPAVVGAGIVFRPVEIHLAYSRSGKPLSKLQSPAVVAASAPARPILTHLAYSQRGKPFSRYIYPLILPSTPASGGVLVQLAPSSRGRAHSVLFAPPVTTAVFIASPIRIELARNRPVTVHSDLKSPAVIGAGIVFRALDIELAYSVRGKPKSKLAPPIIPPLAPPVEEKIVTRFVRTELADRTPHSRLFPPAVIGAGIVFAPVGITLAPSSRGKPKSFLRLPVIPDLARPIKTKLVRISPVAVHPDLKPPAVIGAGIVFRQIDVELTYSVRGKPKSRLFPPVLPPLAPPVEEKIVTSFVRVEIADRTPHSHLFPPAVVGAGIVFRPVFVSLAPSSRGVPKSKLSPAIIPPTAPPVEEKLVSNLVRVELADRTPHSRLFPPAVVGAGIVFRPVDVELTYQSRGVPKSRLFPPAVVGAGIAFYGPLIELAPSFKGQPKSHLFAPVIPPVAPPVEEKLVTNFVRVELADRTPHSRLFPPPLLPPIAQPIKITLVRIKPVPTHSVLRKGIVGAGIVFEPVFVKTALRPRDEPQRAPYYKLRPPTVVQPITVIFFGPKVELAAPNALYTRSLQRQPHSILRKGIVGAGIVFRPIKVKLAPSAVRPGHYKLSAPPKILKVAFPGISTSLAPQSRRPGRVFLRPMGPEKVVFAPVEVHLAPSTRGIPKSILREPAVVGAGRVFAPVSITLAPSKFGQPIFLLKPPTVVIAAAAFFGPQITLAPSTRLPRQAKSVLRPAIFPPLAPPIKVTLAPIPRRKTTSFLPPPSAVRVPPSKPIQVTLVRRVTPPTISILGKPELRHAPFAPIRIRLSQPPPTFVINFLRAPQVVNPVESFGPPRIVLAPSPHPAPYFLRRIVVLFPFAAQRGDVCGFIFTPTADCGDTETTTQSIGAVSSTSSITGGSSSSSTIISGQGSQSSVIGDNRKAT